MCVDVFENLVFNDPFETVQLGYSGFQKERLFFVKQNRGSLMAAENVEPFFAETLQFQFVLVMHFEPHHFAVARVGWQFVNGVIQFGVIGDEPIYNAKRNT